MGKFNTFEDILTWQDKLGVLRFQFHSILLKDLKGIQIKNLYIFCT